MFTFLFSGVLTSILEFSFYDPLTLDSNSNTNVHTHTHAVHRGDALWGALLAAWDL